MQVDCASDGWTISRVEGAQACRNKLCRALGRGFEKTDAAFAKPYHISITDQHIWTQAGQNKWRVQFEQLLQQPPRRAPTIFEI